MIDFNSWGTSELIERIKEYESLKRCPMCTDGTLKRVSQEPATDYDINQPQRPHHGGHHGWICDLCPFVAFEYYNAFDTQELGKYLERPHGTELCAGDGCANFAKELIAPDGKSQPVYCEDCMQEKKEG